MSKQTQAYKAALEQVIVNHTTRYDYLRKAAEYHHGRVMTAANHEQREAHLERAIALTDRARVQINTVLRLRAALQKFAA